MNDFPSLFLRAGQEFATAPRGRTASPDGVWDYVIVAISVIVVVISSYLCVKYFFYPGEKREDHVKNRILSNDVPVKPEEDR